LVLALLDSGSEATLITQHLATVLFLKSQSTNIRLRTFHGDDPAEPTRQVSFNLRSQDNRHSFYVRRAYIVERLNVAQRTINWPDLKKRWPHLSDLPLEGFDSNRVGLFIGVNIPGALKQFEMRVPTIDSHPSAVRTPFGWTVMGPICLPNDHDEASTNQIIVNSTAIPQQINWISHEFITSQDRNQFHLSQEEAARKILASQITMVNGHYVLPLLWKSENPNLPDNRSSALHCFFVNEARCKRDPTYSERITRGMEMYITSNFARKLLPEELDGPPGRTWYLPYFIVLHPRTGKPRLVFHASKQFKGRSLNDELHLKPDLLTPLLSVLLHFREYPVAVSMDVVKMFLQVGVAEQDQDALRFVYRRPGTSGPPITYRMMVQIFGAASSMTSCVYALQQTARDNPGYEDIASKLKDCFYVDNYLDSFVDEEAAIYDCTSLIELFRKGGFELSQLISSSHSVLRTVPTNTSGNPTLSLDFDTLPEESTLGLRWNGNKDCFIFSLSRIATPSTKREMLSAINKIFDPLGFLTCVVMPAKFLLQEVWRRERDAPKNRKTQNWDRRLPEDIITSWKNLTTSWQQLENLEIPRCLQPAYSPDALLQIHIFCDASKAAKGAVGYPRASSSSGITVTFILAKSKVSKLSDRDTIPQAELKAARIGALLDNKIRRTLRINTQPTVFWVDSEAVLYWLRAPSEKRNPRYVSTHRQAILECSTPNQWRHVPTQINPADDITRGIKASSMLDGHRFIHGPSFLKLSEVDWPVQPSDLSILNNVVI